MSDALDAMNLYSDSAYDDLIKEADIDERVGKHQAVVVKVVHDTWESGDPRNKFGFTLLTAHNAKADLTLSPPPPPDVVAATKSTWEPGKKKAIAGAISMLRQLATHYSKRLSDIREGDTYYVQTAKTRREKDGTGGFIRVVAFLDPKTANGAAGGGGDATGSGGPGF